MRFTHKDPRRNRFMLTGKFAKHGYDWWWHSFTGTDIHTGEEKAFFIEYFTCNPALAKQTPTFGQLKGEKPSYVMIKAGAWGMEARQLHRFFAWHEVELNQRPTYSVHAADCYASETHLRGSVQVTEADVQAHPEYMSDSGTMSWDLQMQKVIPFNVGYGANWLFRVLKAFEMYWHVEGMKTMYTGEVQYNGKTYQVTPETSYGYADKNWGSDFTSPWIWLASSDITSQKTGKKLANTAFDIGGGKPKVFGWEVPRQLLAAIAYEGEEFEFNFSKFWTLPKTKFDCQETATEIIWHVYQENRFAAMETKINCQKSDMLCINYEAPSGQKRYSRLWNGGNGQGTLKLWKKVNGKLQPIDTLTVAHVGCEYGEFDRQGM
ncbi:MAG: tocopherol cyclase family protein [Culicoidibacterales bacterium]